MAPALTSCCRFSSMLGQRGRFRCAVRHQLPECVMFNRAPVAFLCTLISFDLASLVKGANAPDLAILALFSSCVARLVIQPTALH